MSDVVRYEVDGEVAVITANSPPVNALGHAVRVGLSECFARAVADDSVRAIALLCEGRTFFAGADITEFGKPPKDPVLRVVHDDIEGAPKPVVAGMFGTTLGGGLETAMACHYRVGVRSLKVGLPEVKLGILPGAGGTQRLPRLVGVERAIEIICTGDMVTADEALERGVIDEITDGDLREATLAFARRLLTTNAPLVKVRDRNDKVTGVDRQIFARARAEWGRKKRGFIAPQRCLDAIEAATTMDFDAGMALRARAVPGTDRPRTSPSRAAPFLFRRTRQANKIPDVSRRIRPRSADIRNRRDPRRRNHGRRHRHELR